MALVYESSEFSTKNNFSDNAGDNAYNITQLSYPANLDSPEYGGNKVIFFINVNMGGRTNVSGAATAYDVKDIPNGEGGGTTAGEKIINTLGSGTEGETKTNDGVINTFTGGVSKRLKSAIVLHMPNNVENTYSVGWNEVSGDEMMDGQMIASGLTKAADAITGKEGDNVSSLAKDLGAYGGAKLLGKMPGKSYAQKTLRMTPGNSQAELLFERVDFRTFGFNYLFSPKTPEEVKNVMSIIRMFRHHMLPDYKGNVDSFLYVYPSEFMVKYFHKDKENEYIEKQLTAVLTSMNVNYTPTGMFAAFDKGVPQQISVSMSFRELSVATKSTSPFGSQGI